MSSKMLDRYQELTELIEQADMACLIELGADVYSKNKKPKTGAEIYARTRREKTATVALCARRLLANMELILQGDKRFVDQFKRDYENVIDAVAILEGTIKGDKLTPEAVELILLSSTSRSKFLSVLRSCLGISISRIGKVSADFYPIAFGVINYYLDNRMLDECKAAAQGLVFLSRRYNAVDCETHRAVVTRCLAFLVDVDSQKTLWICEAEKKHFEKRTDAFAAEFYWFYAFACQANGKVAESLPLFLHCNKLCLQVEGENSWLAARARYMYHWHLFREGTKGQESFLWEFIKNAEAGNYTFAGEMVLRICALARYGILAVHLERQTIRDYFSEIQKHMAFSEAHQEEMRHPCITVRTAANLMSGYYLETGAYLQAEEKMLEALNTIPPEGVEKMPSDDLIMSNLLQIYIHLNDAERILKLANSLLEKLADNDLPMNERYRYFSLVQSAYAQLGCPVDEDIPGFKQILAETYEAMMEGDTADLDKGGASGAYSAVTMIAAIGDTFSAAEKELRRYQTIIQYFLDNPHTFAFSDGQFMAVYQELARINWNLNNKDALKYMKKSLAFGSSLPDFNMARLMNCRIASVVFFNMGETGKAAEIAENALKSITEAWHNVISYINTRRVCQVLVTAQECYNLFYGVISAQKSPEYAYDQLLRYKDLPALAGRERNRYLNGDAVDKKLRDHVYDLQDRLADAQMVDAVRDTDTADEISRELQEAEAAFARSFPRSIRYTEISLERLGKKLKKDEAIIEYYFTPCEDSLRGAPCARADRGLDIFVLTKKHGRINLARTRIRDGERILNVANAFVDVMQNPDDSAWVGEKEKLREDLYRTLLEIPCRQLDQVSTLYIAPDLALCNLPFEILYSCGRNLLHETVKVCRIACGRDLLFFDDTTAHGNESLVIGDPDFEAVRGEPFEDRFRQAPQHLEPVQELPFSGIEAQRVARRCRTTPFVGKAATKYVLQKASRCRIIHIATHGEFDETLESDAMYSSYLIFAGYNNWVKNKTQSTYCGNGILTADEISRMDLRNTELVVLSACNSGMGDYYYRSVQGLLSAFSAAGVRWVISHMWKANDYTTPILMDAFYYAYRARGMDVPEALHYAKDYLRTATIGQLRRGGWLTPDNGDRLSEAVRKELQGMRDTDDRRKPFMDESYWGGFVCYKCK